MEQKRGRSVATKVNMVIIVALTVGIGGMAAYFVVTLATTRQNLTSAATAQAGDLLYQSIKNFMIPGEAPLAVNLFSDIGMIRPDFNIALYRRNGDLAFSDNTTLETVNKNQTQFKFQPHDRPPPANPQKPFHPQFEQALGSLPTAMPGEVFFYENSGGRFFSHGYRPLINLPKCTVCHGGDHTVRGVLDVKTDVTGSVRAEQFGAAGAAGAFLAVLIILVLVLSRYLRRIVIQPVQLIGRLCVDVTNGDFSGRVSVEARDEIGALASTVNTMVGGLRERHELTKYVSGSTIRSLQGDQSGKREPRLVMFTDIRGFTLYSERQGPERVVTLLNRLLDMQSELIVREGGDVDKFVGDAVVAVFPIDAGKAACRAALAIKERLRAASAEFDGLNVGMGVASGDVIQGMIGSARRADFTVIGDVVNVASRLCSLAKPGQILVSETVVREAKDEYRFQGPASVKLKGREAPQLVYALAGRISP